MNKLKELRQQKKLSQKELATAFNKYLQNKDLPVKDNHGKIKNISYATISRWENGQTPIPSIYYSSLADFFGVSVPYFQGFTYSKIDILKILNNAYVAYELARINNSVPSLQDEEIQLVIDKYLWSMDLTAPNKIFTTKQLLNFDNSPKVKEYWLLNFSFLFSTSSVNDYIQNGGNISDLKRTLAREIEERYLKENETEISKHFSKNVLPYLNTFNILKNDLVRFGSDAEIKEYVEELIGKLNEFEKDIDALPPNSKQKFME